jgi:hypothetical protein
MTKHKIGTHEEWLAARLELLEADSRWSGYAGTISIESLRCRKTWGEGAKPPWPRRRAHP